jgi:hypothetical protein
MNRSVPHRPSLVTNPTTPDPALKRAKELLEQTGAAWDKAYHQLNDEPTPEHMRVFQAAQQAYIQAQRTYLLAVTVSRLPQLPAAVPSLNQEYIDATTNL